MVVSCFLWLFCSWSPEGRHIGMGSARGLGNLSLSRFPTLWIIERRCRQLCQGIQKLEEVRREVSWSKGQSKKVKRWYRSRFFSARERREPCTLQILATEKLPAEFQSTVCDSMWQYATVWALVSSGLLSTCPWVNKQLNQLNYSWIKSEALWFVWCCLMFLHATWMHSGFVFWQVSDSDCGPPPAFVIVARIMVVRLSLPTWSRGMGRSGICKHFVFRNQQKMNLSKLSDWFLRQNRTVQVCETRHVEMLKCAGTAYRWWPLCSMQRRWPGQQLWEGMTGSWQHKTAASRQGSCAGKFGAGIPKRKNLLSCRLAPQHNRTWVPLQSSFWDRLQFKKGVKGIERIWNFFFVWSSPFSCENAWVNSERLKLTDFDYE